MDIKFICDSKIILEKTNTDCPYEINDFVTIYDNKYVITNIQYTNLHNKGTLRNDTVLIWVRPLSWKTYESKLLENI